MPINRKAIFFRFLKFLFAFISLFIIIRIILIIDAYKECEFYENLYLKQSNEYNIFYLQNRYEELTSGNIVHIGDYNYIVIARIYNDNSTYYHDLKFELINRIFVLFKPTFPENTPTTREWRKFGLQKLTSLHEIGVSPLPVRTLV